MEAVLFSFGYILKAKVSWTYSQHGQGEEGRGAMAGVREGGGPPQPLHPKEHMSTWGGSPSVSCLPPPTAPNKRRSPLPQGLLPTPTWAVHSVVFSSPMAQGATGWGRWPTNLKSLSWTVAVTWVCGPSQDPQFVPFVFSEGWYTTL